MKKLEELLKEGWEIEIALGMSGKYFINASSRKYRPVLTSGETLTDAIGNLYKLIHKIQYKENIK